MRNDPSVKREPTNMLPLQGSIPDMECRARKTNIENASNQSVTIPLAPYRMAIGPYGTAIPSPSFGAVNCLLSGVCFYTDLDLH